MTLTVSNNSAVAFASHYLGENQKKLQTSIKKLASGKRIVGGAEDPGTLSVSMKLNAAVTRLTGARNNVQNGISFMEVQDGMLETAGRIINRMAEMKGMATADPMKSDQDVDSYNNEFHDLQQQLFQISQQTFNGSSIFANTVDRTGTFSDPTNADNLVVFKSDTKSHALSIFTSDNGSTGTKISIFKASLLSALTIGVATADRDTAYHTGGAAADRHTGTGVATADKISFAASISTDVWDLDAVSMAVFEKALENIAYLRAEGGGSMSRLNFAADSIASYTTNMRAALGRIEDVDIAEESSNLAKFSILTQAAAAMVAQANTTNDVALMLLR
jgi:flagellin